MFSCFAAVALSFFGPSDPNSLLDADLLPYRIRLSPDGKTLAIAGGTQNGGEWKLFDLATGNCILDGTQFKQRCGGVFALACTNDNSFIAYGGNHKKLFVVDTKNKKPYWDLADAGHTGHPNALSFTPDGTNLISSAHDGTLRIWDVPNRKLLAVFVFEAQLPALWHLEKAPRMQIMEGLYAHHLHFALSPQGGIVAVGGISGKVPLMDLTTGKIFKIVKPRQDACASLSFTSDGRWLLVGGSRENAKIEIWDVKENKLVHSFGQHDYSINRIAISPDKKTLVSGGTLDGFRVWDVATGKQKFSYFTKNDRRMPRVKVNIEDASRFVQENTLAAGCAFLPDGKTFLIVPSWALWTTEVYFHDTVTGRPADFRERVRALPKPQEKKGKGVRTEWHCFQFSLRSCERVRTFHAEERVSGPFSLKGS